MTSSVAALQAEDDADGLVAMERQHLLQLKKSLETEMGLIQQQLKVSCSPAPFPILSIIPRSFSFPVYLSIFLRFSLLLRSLLPYFGFIPRKLTTASDNIAGWRVSLHALKNKILLFPETQQTTRFSPDFYSLSFTYLIFLLNYLICIINTIAIGHQIKSNQLLYNCAPKSWPESWPTLSAAHRNN